MSHGRKPIPDAMPAKSAIGRCPAQARLPHARRPAPAEHAINQRSTLSPAPRASWIGALLATTGAA
jgi:hypothetical protein